jgi:drug/metabolite transporter (DMT)-like permease
MTSSTELRAKLLNKPENVKSVYWALLATAMFSVAAAMAKVAVNEYHVLQILFFRQIIVFLSCLPSIAKSFPASLKTQHPKIHAARLLGAFVALSCGIWAVSVLPLTTATTLGFAQVLFVALLAWVFLKETVGIHRLSAIFMGFIGVVIVMRPGGEEIINLNALIPIMGAIGAGVAIISVRKLSQTESTATLLIYQALFVGILAGLPLFWLWTTPDLIGILFLLAMGVVAAAANWAGVKALRLGEASVVGNIHYMQLIYAAILGLFLFNEVPDIYTILGAAFIIGSSIYIVRREVTKNQAPLS